MAAEYGKASIIGRATTKSGTPRGRADPDGRGFFYAELGITLRALAAISFLLLTAPVAAHLIGCEAYYSGVKLWEKTWIDQLAERYSAVDGSDPDDRQTTGS